MKRKLIPVVAISLIAALALCIAGCGGSSTGGSAASNGGANTNTVDGDLQFLTGGESGTYYAFGTVLANYCSNTTDTKVTALAGNGSQANVQALQDGDANIAFCQSDVLAYAYNGTNLFESAGAYTDFSIVGCLYQEQVQIVTTNPDIKTVADLKGKNVSVGATGSGVYFNAVDILSAYDLTVNDLNAVYQNFADSTDSLKNGKIDAAFVVAGAPTTSITDLSTAKQCYLVSLDDEHINKLLAASPYYAKATIPASAYGLDSDTTTVSVGAVIIANNNVSDTAVYNFISSVFAGAKAQPDAHAKYSELDLETAASITTVPYHAGAAKYFSEQGVTVKTK